MNRARLTFAATLVCASFAAIVALAQTPQAPPMTSVLAGKKFTPAFKGQADIDFVKPTTKRDKDMVVTTMMVKNITDAAILRRWGVEPWYDEPRGVVTGGKGVVQRLEPGEVQTVKIETPYNAKMSANNYNFSHANGTVKPHRVDKLVAAGDSKEPAAKTASATKASTSKSKKK